MGPRTTREQSPVASELPCGSVAALELLLEAYEYATRMSHDVWDFAVENVVVENCGISRSGIRYLVCHGLVEHARECNPVRGQARSFRPTGILTFHRRTCFVLSDAGVQFARSLRSEPDALKQGDDDNGHPTPSPNGVQRESVKPTWDPIRQELRVNKRVVKRFKVPAPNQELVLAVFEEEGWPLRIDDPLPCRAEQDPKRRLHDTINALNRRHIHPLLRFLGDGKASGIRWELRKDAG